MLLYLNFYSCKHEPIIAPGTNTNNTGNNNGNPPPQHRCDTNVVYFQKQILPILLSNCTMSRCHDGSGASEASSLISYNAVLQSGYVNVNNPAGSRIYRAVTQTNPDDKMPPSPNTPLNLNQIKLILKWIQQGAKNIICDDLCDSVNVKYSTTISIIMQNYCIGCHSGTNPAKGISLTTYAQVADISNPAKGNQMIGAITGAAGFILMPYNSSKMPECEIAQIKKWIADGRPNN